jgi:hypothetical protein
VLKWYVVGILCFLLFFLDIELRSHTLRYLFQTQDKVTLKLFASTVDAGKLERALDLVDRLHLEKSYDLAITLADRHHKLADFIEGARERRFAVDAEEEDNEEDDSPSTTRMRQLESSRQISPEANAAAKKRSLGGFQPNPISTKRRVNL